MKTSVIVPKALLLQAKREAARRGITLRTLFEEALRAALSSSTSTESSFRLRDASVRGRGLSPEFARQSPAAWLAATYRGRGS